jgi:transposase
MTPTGSVRLSPSGGITACIPSKSNRKKPIEHDHTLYRQRHKIENMFGRIKDWRRVRPMRSHIHVSHMHRRCRHLLAMINES